MNQGLRQNGIASPELGKVQQEELSLHTGKMPVPPLGEEQLLEAIAIGDQSAADIARDAGISILELAEHVCTAQNIAALGRVAQLHAIEREMLLGQLKRDALMRLRELTDEVPAANADEVRAAEVMRKACVDLLRYGESSTSNTSPRQTQSLPPEPLTPAFEAEVLEALERLGEEREEEEYPRHHHSGQARPGGQAGGQAPITQIEDSPGRMGHEVKVNEYEYEQEPRAQTNGTVTPPPPSTVTTRTGEMPLPLEICNGNEASKLSGEDGSRFEDGHPP